MTAPEMARAARRREREAADHADWLLRRHAPAWLDLAGLPAEAQRLRVSTDPPNDLHVVCLEVEERRRAERNLSRRWVLWRAAVACSNARAAIQRAETERTAAASDRMGAARCWAAEQPRGAWS